MPDPVENQPQTLHDIQETAILAGEEDPLIQQSQQVELFVGALRKQAHLKILQPQIDRVRSSLDSHTAAETILAMFDDNEALQQGTERIVYEVFDHEINNLVIMMRHTLFLSDRPIIPEDQWGAPNTTERMEFESQLSQAWGLSNSKLRQLKEALQFIYGKQGSVANVEDILDSSIQSAYVGMYISEDMVYPHHAIDVNTLRTIAKGLQNVKRLLLADPEEQRLLLTEMNDSKVRIGDFIDIFPDRHMYIMSGNLDRELNQFEINLFFEMLHNAKKYKLTQSEPIEIFISDSGQIDVKNRSKQKMDTDLAAFGTRGDESLEQNGNGFGIFKMKAIARMTGETMEFASDPLIDDEPPLYVITCSLKQAT